MDPVPAAREPLPRDVPGMATGWIKRIGRGLESSSKRAQVLAEPGATSAEDDGPDGLATLRDNGGSSAYLRPQRAAATCRARSGGASGTSLPSARKSSLDGG